MPRKRIIPDRVALEIVHSSLQTKMTVDEMLNNQTQAVVLKTLARKHIRRRERIDVKKLQANDND